MTSARHDQIAISSITTDGRLRPADHDYVAALADNIALQGLKTPVLVRPVGKRFALVAGLHRLEACRTLGHERIPAQIEDMTPAQAVLVEIDENLLRADLNALDRAIFIDRRISVLQELGEIDGRGGDRKSDERDQTAKLAVRTEVASRLGLSERSIRRARALVRDLAPECIPYLRQSDLADNASALEGIARLPRSEQVKAAQRAAAGEKQPSGRKHEGSEHPPGLRRLIKAWNAADRDCRSRFREITKDLEVTDAAPEG